MTGSILKICASKEAYQIVRQLEKITVKKAQAKQKTNLGSLGIPLGHLSVKRGHFDYFNQ